MVRIESETNQLFIVESVNKKTAAKEFYTWALENKKANQKSVGHYLKVGKATVVTASNDTFESLESIVS